MSEKKTPSAAPAPQVATAPPAEPKESKAAKFRRLANRRVGKALKVLSHVESLANVKVYERTPEQTKKLLGLIDDAVSRIKAAYNGQPTAPASL